MGFKGKFFDPEESILKLSNQIESLRSLFNQINSSIIDINDEIKDNYNIFNIEISVLKNQIKLSQTTTTTVTTTTTTVTTTTTNSYPIKGIQNNIAVSTLIRNGYSYVYNKPYSHMTTIYEMETIKNSCSTKTTLCFGGVDSTNDVLLVVSCGLCSVVLTPQSAKNSPNLYNRTYWYYTPNVAGSRSIGFSPNQNIDQRNSDHFDLSSDQRLSWRITGDHGGFRLGSLIWLSNNTRYYKVILKKINV